ncbi:acetylxylan esterase [Virgisporangium ochraceum]|uniref:Acetylxylan esterase n=1 Tax=Virgisporangium ochraceum TaxID=65505 RepID=A0A8J4ECF2_9ACTN|nr:acetylxylan esterase [Virgisporangium ochraceum]GIJ66822.1 acetylxylan esterase [Virgisporangium ochraceum]
MALFDLPLPELRRYSPEVPEPDDFDAFWKASVPSGEALVEVRPHSTSLRLVDTFDVTFTGFGGAPVKAWYTRPAGTREALPAVVEYLGYGRGRGLPHERLTWVTAGYAHLLMDSRGQGDQYGSGGGTPDPHGGAPGGPGPVTRGILAPEDYYYRRLMSDAVRAVAAVRELSGVDPTRVAVCGNSQGGGLALAVAGLVPDLAAVLVSAPFLCHVQRAIDITDAAPYGEIVAYLSVHRDAETAVRRTLSYVDGVSFARRATAPGHWGVGLRDTVCPPSTVFAAYNRYGHDDRTIEVYPFNHHEGGDAHHVARQLDWLAARI